MSFIIQRGHGMPVYSGQVRRQMGGSIFSTIGRVVIPLAKKLFGASKPHLKHAARTAINQTVKAAPKVIGSVISGNANEIPNEMKNIGKRTIDSLGKDYLGTPIFDHPEAKRAKPINKKKEDKKQRRNKKKNRTTQERDIFTSAE